jgi:hypothetical protein
MAETPQNQILNPEIIRTPEIPNTTIENVTSTVSQKNPMKSNLSSVDDTLAADQKASVTDLETTMSIDKPQEILIVGDSLTGKEVESWFTSSNDSKK